MFEQGSTQLVGADGRHERERIFTETPRQIRAQGRLLGTEQLRQIEHLPGARALDQPVDPTLCLLPIEGVRRHDKLALWRHEELARLVS
jgi:hypothetical protein